MAAQTRQGPSEVRIPPGPSFFGRMSLRDKWRVRRTGCGFLSNLISACCLDNNSDLDGVPIIVLANGSRFGPFAFWGHVAGGKPILAKGARDGTSGIPLYDVMEAEAEVLVYFRLLKLSINASWR